MLGRERFLAAIQNEKPDRLPCQVHSFMDYYLKTYLNGMNQFEAYEFLEMDPVIYQGAEYEFDAHDLSNWVKKEKKAKNSDGNVNWERTFVTPKGNLTVKGETNQFTEWDTEYLIKNQADFELFKEFFPVPISCDNSGIIQAKKRIGQNGIVRACAYLYGQGGAWQSLCYMMGAENVIMLTFDEPEWVHYALETINNKFIDAVNNCGKIENDLIETGGGAGSSTVISPSIHREFCLPYDKKLHQAIKEQGAHITYHLCGGLMPLLEIVKENGADCLETMTPSAMGGDCDLKKATEIAGDKLCFIGGFDQNQGFEKGTPQIIRPMVEKLFYSKPNGGYICSPSDHFFFGDKENLIEFSKVCKSLKY